MKMHYSGLLITALLIIICSNSISSQSTASPSGTQAVAANAEKGQQLFSGNIRFVNGGPACNSCHNVSIKGFVSGGALGKDLTQAVSRLTVDGAKAFFSGSTLPMPQMQQSYEGKQLTAEEVNDIAAFLKHADDLVKTQPENTIGEKMLIGGIGGVFVLLVLFTFFWIKRKKRTVNYSIYKRQIKSA